MTPQGEIVVTAWRIPFNTLQFERAVIQFNFHLSSLKLFFFFCIEFVSFIESVL